MCTWRQRLGQESFQNLMAHLLWLGRSGREEWFLLRCFSWLLEFLTSSANCFYNQKIANKAENGIKYGRSYGGRYHPLWERACSFDVLEIKPAILLASEDYHTYSSNMWKPVAWDLGLMPCLKDVDLSSESDLFRFVSTTWSPSIQSWWLSVLVSLPLSSVCSDSGWF